MTLSATLHAALAVGLCLHGMLERTDPPELPWASGETARPVQLLVIPDEPADRETPRPSEPPPPPPSPEAAVRPGEVVAAFAPRRLAGPAQRPSAVRSSPPAPSRVGSDARPGPMPPEGHGIAKRKTSVRIPAESAALAPPAPVREPFERRLRPPRPQRRSLPLASGSPGADSAAEPLRRIAPQYPRLSVRRGEQGTVVIAARLSARGRVASARVARSSGHARLDAAALAAVRKARFRPARRAGKPVPGRVRVPIRFVLETR